MEWSAGRAAVEIQAHPGGQMSPHNVQSFLCRGAFTGSYAEALPTATHPLDVGIVEDELAAQLRLHKVHLGPEEGQLGFLLNEHPHTFGTETAVNLCTVFAK